MLEGVSGRWRCEIYLPLVNAALCFDEHVEQGHVLVHLPRDGQNLYADFLALYCLHLHCITVQYLYLTHASHPMVECNWIQR